jgi:hypothetical protein
MIAEDLTAHAKADFNKKSCKSWRKKYKASADLILGIVPVCYSQRRSCGGVYLPSSANCSQSCGDAEAYIHPPYSGANPQSKSDCIYYEYEKGRGSIPCFAGFSPASDLFVDIFNANRINKANYGYEDISYEAWWGGEQSLGVKDNTYKMSNTFGYMKVHKKFYGTVKLELIVWKSEDDLINEIEDTLITTEKVLIKEYIMINNGEIILSEGFKEFKDKNIFVEVNNDFVTIDIRNLNYDFVIPSHASIEKDVVVTTGTYSEPNHDHLLEEKLAKSNSEKILTIYPNPTSTGFINVKIEENDLSKDKLQFKIFNQKGQVVRNYDINAIKNDDIVYTISLEELPNGIYYLSISNEIDYYSVHEIIIRK